MTIIVGALPGNLPIFDGQGYEDMCVKMEAIPRMRQKSKTKYIRRTNNWTAIQFEIVSMIEEDTIVEYFNKIKI